MPFLTALGNIMGIAGGTFIATLMTKLTLVEYVNRTIKSLSPENLCESFLKSIVFGLLIAGVGCLRGFEASNDAKGVGNATTSAVVSGIFLVVLADFTITFTFPNILHLVRMLSGIFS